MPDNSSVVVISLGEWLGWMTHSQLRCLAARITVIHGDDDSDGLVRALDRAPFEKVTDDQALLVAVLSPDYLCHARLQDSAAGLDALWLPLQAVSEFVPLSDRGLRLLEGDAERAGCRLAAPRFEQAWTRWVEASLARFADLRGLAFARVLGLEPDSMPAQWCSRIPVALDVSGVPGSEKRELYRATCALGWAEMLALVREALGEENRDRIRAIPGVKDLLEARAGRFRLAAEDFGAEDALTAVSAVEALYQEVHGEVLPALAIAVVCHYRHIKALDKDIDAAVLGTNLGLVRDRYGEGCAALAACRIGREMADHEVYSLVHVANKDAIPALAGRPLPFDPRKLVPPVKQSPPAGTAVAPTTGDVGPPSKESEPARQAESTEPAAPDQQPARPEPAQEVAQTCEPTTPALQLESPAGPGPEELPGGEADRKVPNPKRRGASPKKSTSRKTGARGSKQE